LIKVPAKNIHISPDFKKLFESVPGLYLILLPDLTIVAVSDTYASATMTKRHEILGKGLFDVFPDNPNDPNADGVSNLRASLEFVLKNKTAHTMPVQKYDIRRHDGTFEERFWSPLNKPVLDNQNDVMYLIHRVEDVTELIRLQQKEAQNQELRKQQILQLKESEEKFQKTFQLSPAGITLTDASHGKWVEVNDSFLKITGYSRGEVIGKTSEELGLIRDEREKIAEEILKTGSVKNKEVIFRKKSGETGAALFSHEKIVLNGKPHVISVIYDITKRREAEEKIRQMNAELEKRVSEKTNEVIEKEKSYRQTLDNMLEGVQIIGFDWKYLYVNNSLAKHARYSKEELLGHTVMEKYPGIEKSPTFAMYERCFKERVSFQVENEFTFPDGSKGWFELSFQPVPEGIFILSIDITERKKAQEKLIRSEAQIRNFARHLNQVLEGERSHIAREIHDELGQQLAGIKMGIASFKNVERPITDVATYVNSILKDVDETIQSLRKIATELRPGILDTLGLVPSIEWLVKEFEKKNPVTCILTKNVKENKFEQGLSTCFFRICQEALTNISKHAGANEVVVEIRQEKADLVLRVSDNGKGMASDKLDNPFSMGLLGMRERASLAGGHLNITSKKNQGTTVELSAKIN